VNFNNYFRSVYNFLQQRDQLLAFFFDKADIIFLADFIFLAS